MIAGDLDALLAVFRAGAVFENGQLLERGDQTQTGAA